MKRSTILAIFLCLITGFIAFKIGKTLKLSETKPFRALCWQNDQSELQGFTPAYWVEREGIRHMIYEPVRLKCRGEIAGYMMDWDADQFWLKRTGINKVTTR